MAVACNICDQYQGHNQEIHNQKYERDISNLKYSLMNMLNAIVEAKDGNIKKVEPILEKALELLQEVQTT